MPREKRQTVTAAVLLLDLRTMARDIIQNTIQQVEAGLDALPTDQ